MIQKMCPAVCVAIPIYLVMRGVGLIDTIPGLVIVNYHLHEADSGIPENLHCPEQTLAAWAAEACAP